MSDTHVWIDGDGPIRETEKAELHGTDAGEVWIPKSVIGARSSSRLEVARWWAEKNGLAESWESIGEHPGDDNSHFDDPGEM